MGHLAAAREGNVEDYHCEYSLSRGAFVREDSNEHPIPSQQQGGCQNGMLADLRSYFTWLFPDPRARSPTIVSARLRTWLSLTRESINWTRSTDTKRIKIEATYYWFSLIITIHWLLDPVKARLKDVLTVRFPKGRTGALLIFLHLNISLISCKPCNIPWTWALKLVRNLYPWTLGLLKISSITLYRFQNAKYWDGVGEKHQVNLN